MRTWITPELISAAPNPQRDACFKSVMDWTLTFAGLIPGVECPAAFNDVIQLAVEAQEAQMSGAGDTFYLMLDIAGTAASVGSCIAGITPIGKLLDAAAITFGGIAVVDDCFPTFGQRLWDKLLAIRTVLSFDPNDKIGSAGVGPQHYLSGEEPLRYTVLFENLETATAPAQEVTITDQLDPAKVDLSTFKFGTITFGSQTLEPPEGQSAFTTDVDLRPDLDLIVRVSAQLDLGTGEITWKFASLDPSTGLPPDDPLAGFLPPNVNPPEGEGSVLYTVMTKEGLPSGTEIRNTANIVFDANAPIQTPEWLNTLDNTKPASQIVPLATTQPTTFTVQWSGTDQESGILDYTIYVSENGAAATKWMSNTEGTSGVYTGQVNKTYGFYSVARDQTGNLKEIPAFPDAMVTVIGSTNGPDLTGFWTKPAAKCKLRTTGLQCSLKGKFTVQNKGTAIAPSTVLRFYLSSDATFDGGDTQLGSDVVIRRPIKVGKTGKAKLKTTLPVGANPSGKFLLAVVDAVNTVSESDETNNVIVFGPLP
jgi:hypothetical protein